MCTSLQWLLWWTIGSATHLAFANEPTKSPLEMKGHILVLGGNGFIGSETVAYLLEEGYKVTCVSRGNWYWDSETRIKPFVTYLQCDRHDGLKTCSNFMAFLLSLESPLNVVIDFSGYSPEVVENATQLLSGHAKLYLYISTDSVYEVSVALDERRPSREEDARRPVSVEEQRRLNQMDSYGHRKLACEEVLKTQKMEGGIPYVIIRLPDVIGPRDTTNRWWVYQLWMQFYQHVHQAVMIPPKVQQLRTSYVYVKDVVKVLTLIVKSQDQIENNEFNIALGEQLTLHNLLNDMKNYLGNNNVDFTYADDPASFYLFPSVSRGPIDISKAKQLLAWSPTPWHQALSETVEFYKHAFYTFPKERDEAMHTLLTYVVAPDDKPYLIKAIDDDVRKHSSDVEINAEATKESTATKNEL